jgi:hypothetical protein
MSGMNDGFDIDNDGDVDGGSGLDGGSAYDSRVGVVKVARRDYAVGLQWNTLQEPSRAVEEARTFAQQPMVAADVFGVRQSANPQFAVGFRSYGHRANQPSLAAHAARAKGGSWIGLFEVSGGYYLLGVRDDAIISEFDRFFDDEAAAIKAYESFSYMSWDDVIAPASLKLGQKNTTTLESLLIGKPPVKLQDVKRTSPVVKIAVAVAAVVAIFIGVSSYMDGQKQAELQEQARVLAEQAARTVSREPEEPPPPAMPWEGEMLGAKFLDKCVTDVRKFRLAIPGWSVNEFYCKPQGTTGSAAAAIDRKASIGAGGGSVNWIAKYTARDDFHPSLTPKGGEPRIIPPMEGSGGRVSVQWSLSGIEAIPVDIKTIPVGQVRLSMLQIFEDRQTPIRFGSAVKVNPKYWNGLGFEFTTQLDPLAYADVIASIPGALITDVKYTIATNTWSIKGEAYEQIPQPKKVR